MEKNLYRLLAAIMVTILSISFTSCGDDNDEPKYDSVESIIGTYVGKLNMVGYSDSEAEVAYVTLTKKSSSTVVCKIESEGWGVDMTPVNLAVTFYGNTVSLESESNLTISGQIINGNMQLTYQTVSEHVFQFIGALD